MITGEIKNRVDSIWDVFWTGGITNSMTVLEQMTYLFFMKMLDDSQTKKEANAAAFGTVVKDATFKKGVWHNPDTDRDVEYEKLRWHIFRNLAPDEMYRIVSKDVFAFIKNLDSGKQSAYSRFMANATFMIQSARTLVKIVEGIDSLDMNNRDTMGDVYEYILGQMAASGKNGQFRTPRHIINMIVDLVKPTPTDTILDPAMGTAGFLQSSARYIQENYSKELLNKDTIKHFNTTMFSGYDIDTSMLRIGAMNMLLHGVEEPRITHMNSLSD